VHRRDDDGESVGERAALEIGKAILARRARLWPDGCRHAITNA
jgi:hypothetical protein